MSKFHGTIKAGSLGVRITVFLTSHSTGTELTGLTSADITSASYYRLGAAAPVAIAPVALAALNSVHAAGGFKEVDATTHPGEYVFDLPDAAVAAGAELVTLCLKGTDILYNVPLALEAQGAEEVYTSLQGVAADTSDVQDFVANQFDTAVRTNVIAALQADSDYQALLANANGDYTITYPDSFPGTGTLVLKNRAGTQTLATLTLSFDEKKRITARASA